MVHHTVSHDGNSSYVEANHPVLLWHYIGVGTGGAPGACFIILLYKLLTTLCVVLDCAPPIKKSFLRLCINVSLWAVVLEVDRDTGVGLDSVLSACVGICEGVRWGGGGKRYLFCNSCVTSSAILVSESWWACQQCLMVLQQGQLFYGVTRQLQMSTISMLVGGVHHKARV